MIAPKAKEDFEDLQREGLAATLEDFDRLNSLALRMQCAAETTAANAPRVGWAGDVPFYQPTLQAFDWYLTYAERVAGDDQTRNTLWYFALANARTAHFFDNLHTPEAIRRVVGKWVSGVNATGDEIARACRYAASGFDNAEPGENPNARQNVQHRGNREKAAVALDALNTKLVRASAALGVAPEVLFTETPSRLDALYERWCVEQGHPLKPNEAQLYADYKFALYEIRQRLTPPPTNPAPKPPAS